MSERTNTDYIARLLPRQTTNQHGFRGVFCDKRNTRFKGKVDRGNIRKRGPYRKTPEEAAHDYDELASAAFGSLAYLNFPLKGEGSVVMGRGTVMIVHPSIENAARWSRMKLSPMMRSIPAVNVLFPQRPRDAADAITYKERVDGLGNLLISGANSAPSLSQSGDGAVRARGRSREVGSQQRRRSRGASRQPGSRA